MGKRNSILDMSEYKDNNVRAVTPGKRIQNNLSASKSGKKRPKSANKISAASKQRSDRINEIYSNSTPSKLNKSVTFNNQVRVREF